MIVDKNYCMNSFFMYRTIADDRYGFSENVIPSFYYQQEDRIPVKTSEELEAALREKVTAALKEGKAALALSGGIDSAILAKFMPEGSTAYTFKCVVPGKKVTDESVQAARYAEECGLKHKVVEITWEDMISAAPILFQRKGMPVHSIEMQIYKASLQAKKDGFDTLIFGESADVNYGGLSSLLSRDWTFGEFVERYSYLLPYHVLREPQLIVKPFQRYEKNGDIDVHEFVADFFMREGLGSYCNATSCAEISLSAPYAQTYLAEDLDLERIRRGENKYLVREIFYKLYSGWKVPEKLPMPRPTNEWLQDWEGPKREEFRKNCVQHLSGDQKWLVFILELFLNWLDKQ